MRLLGFFFCRKLNSEQFLFETFLYKMGIFGSIQLQSESAFHQ